MNNRFYEELDVVGVIKKHGRGLAKSKRTRRPVFDTLEKRLLLAAYLYGQGEDDSRPAIVSSRPSASFNRIALPGGGASISLVGRSTRDPGSSATLQIDLAAQQFTWHSNDRVLGPVDTGGPIATLRWFDSGARPGLRRVLFLANDNGIRYAGNFRFDAVGRGVVDIAGAGGRVRYLLEGLQIPDTDPPPLCAECCEPVACAADDAGTDQDTGHHPDRNAPQHDSGTSGSSVQLHNGSFRHSVTDLTIPGRGFDWSFSRTYRSDVSMLGPLGFNWQFNYERKLRLINDQNLGEMQLVYPDAQLGDLLHFDGANRADFYRQNGTITPQGFYRNLIENPDGTISERDADGMIVTYRAPDPAGFAPMIKMEDRNGNEMTFHYDRFHRLTRVIDTLGRPIDYFYTRAGLLREVRDFNGRSIRFQHDRNLDLIGVRSPAVVGTPTGNDFVDGKTERYAYTSGFADPRLNHKLLTITAPNEVASGGPPRLILTYDPATPIPHLGRVLTMELGGVNDSTVPAGGVIQYQYQDLGVPADPDDTITAIRQTTVTDRNGNQTEYQFNQFNNILRTREFTNRFIRLDDPDFYETTFAWNRDYELLEKTNPLGNVVNTTYDEFNPDRFQQGNSVRTTLFPDARSGDQNQIITLATYEPIYNQVQSFVDPRGTDLGFLPPNGGLTFADRYRTTHIFDYQEGTEFGALAAQLGVTVAEVQTLLTSAGIAMGLGDVNGDGITNQTAGNVIRVDDPTVNLFPGSNQSIVEGDLTQEIVTLYTYNRFGQLTQTVDPEGNVTTYEYFSERDPDGDGTINNPSGDAVTGGYLRRIVIDTTSDPARNSGTDPTPTNIQTEYLYDSVGNVTREVNGRGIATDYIVNELNQVVVIVHAAEHGLFGANPAEPGPLVDFQYFERIFYDANDNVVLRQTEDRGNTSNVDGNPPAVDLPNVPGGDSPDPFGDQAFVDTITKYDILDNVIETIEEVANGAEPEFLHTRYRYDANENQVLTILPEGNATSAIYDERDLLFRTTRGELLPTEANPENPLATAPTLLSPNDPLDYDVRGGVTCQCVTYRYDDNRNVIETVDADDTDQSADNGSTLGPGDRTRYVYDGYDRLTSVIDSVGNQTVHQYDPASNVVRTMRFGPVGGPSPTTDGPDVLAGPVSEQGIVQEANLVNANLLETTEFFHDELNRLYQTDLVLFVNTIPTIRLPDVADGATDIGKGDLTPGDNQVIPGVTTILPDGRVSAIHEYDRNSRVTFISEDDEDTSRFRYDGANRVIEVTDPEGNRVETAYDDNHNVIELRETDVAQVAGVADEIFLTTRFFDSLDRLEQTVNNIGQATDYRYDSRDNLVSTADAQGPLTGNSITRRAFPDGPLTVNAINDFGNVTRYFYDGINRVTREEQTLTDLPPAGTPQTASGDGIHVGASIFGIKDDATAPESFTPIPDVTQGGGDGIIRTGYTYDRNSLSSSLIDDQGNVTLYVYDNLDRRVVETKGLVTTSPFTEDHILGDREVVTPTASSIDNPLIIPEVQIQQQLDAAAGRIALIAALFPPLANDLSNPPPPPQASSIVYGYDPDDNLLILEDENDTEVFTRYDAINRAIAVRVFRNEGNPVAAPADSFVGDPIFAPDPLFDFAGPPRNLYLPIIGTNAQNMEYDGLSRVVRMTDNNDPADPNDDSTVSTAYDSLSRIIEDQQQIGGAALRAVSSAYRADNLRSGVVYPNDRELEYTYDDLDRMNTVTDAGTALPIVDYDYIGTTRVLVRAYPENGTRMTYLDDAGTTDLGYDGLRRPIQQRHLRTDNSVIVGVTHDYDRQNNRLNVGLAHDPTNGAVYTYDSTGRLFAFDRPDVGAIAPLNTRWDLDGVGNWDQVDGTNRQHNSINELTGIVGFDFQYDNNGNQVRNLFGGQDGDEPLIYQWDYLNRLRRVVRESDSMPVAEYAYDAMNRRIRKEVTNGGADNDPALDGTTEFYYDGWQVVEERDGAGDLNQQYVYGVYIDEPLILDVNLDGDSSATGGLDQRLYYHQDTIHNVLALTDQAAQIVEGYLYDPYGRHTLFAPGLNGEVDFGVDDIITPGARSEVGNPYLFTGRRLDGETGGYLYRMRYYDPLQGRFLSRDPLGYLDSMNLYEYVQSDPANNVDPYGLGVSLTDVWVRVLLQFNMGAMPGAENTPLNRAKAMCYKLYTQRLVNLVGEIGWSVMTKPIEVVAGAGVFGRVAKGVSDALGHAETAERAARDLLSAMTDFEHGAYSTRNFNKSECGCDMFLFWNKRTNSYAAYFEVRVSRNLDSRFRVQCCPPYEDTKFLNTGTTNIVTRGYWPITWESLKGLTGTRTRQIR